MDPIWEDAPGIGVAPMMGVGILAGDPYLGELLNLGGVPNLVETRSKRGGVPPNMFALGMKLG